MIEKDKCFLLSIPESFGNCQHENLCIHNGWHTGICSQCCWKMYTKVKVALSHSISFDHSVSSSVWYKPAFSLFFPHSPSPQSILVKLYLHNTPAKYLAICHIHILHPFAKLYSRMKNFCTCTREKIHRNLKNSRQHFETSKENYNACEDILQLPHAMFLFNLHPERKMSESEVTDC